MSDGVRTLARELGLRVQSAREACGMSIAELSEKTSCVDAFLRRIERGATLPNLYDFGRLCVVLGVSADELLGLPTPEKR